MSESSEQPQPPGSVDRLVQVEQTLREILQRMDLPAKLEVKDAADRGISVALTVEVDLPGVALGRRSNLADSLQFLLNKILNRPGVERRWVSIGIGGHPEPRGERAPKAPKPPPSSPAAATPAAPADKGRPPGSAPPSAAAAPRAAPQARPARRESGEADERTADVTPDPALAAAARELAEKAARLGRFYAIAPMKADDRARVLKAVEGVIGVKVTVEGEGRSRRVVFTPDKPVPLPKRNLPEMDDDEELEEP